MVPKSIFQLNLVPKLTLGAEVHRLVPKLICAEVNRAEHRLPLDKTVMKKLDLITLVYYEPSLPENVTTKCVILMNHGKTTFNLN